MNARDYARDNRLRLWFLGVEDYRQISAKELRLVSRFREQMFAALSAMASALRPYGRCVLVLGDSGRSRARVDTATLTRSVVGECVPALTLEYQYTQRLPHRRRSRRSGRATTKDTVLVFKKRAR